MNVAAEQIAIKLGTEIAPELLLAIFRQAVADSLHSPVVDENGARSYLERIMNHGLIVVASTESSPIGLLICEVGAEEWGVKPFMDVRIFYVVPGYRHGQVTWEFLKAIADYADLNALDVTLSVPGRYMRMMNGRGLKAEYDFIGGVFARRANREEEAK